VRGRRSRAAERQGRQRKPAQSVRVGWIRWRSCVASNVGLCAGCGWFEGGIDRERRGAFLSAQYSVGLVGATGGAALAGSALRSPAQLEGSSLLTGHCEGYPCVFPVTSSDALAHVKESQACGASLQKSMHVLVNSVSEN
jgi:hypothetical protein